MRINYQCLFITFNIIKTFTEESVFMYSLEAKELLMENPLLYADVEKYIWIDDSYEKHKEAQRLFCFFLQKKIYVKGFVTNLSSMVGLKMFHKSIFGIEVLNQDKSFVFCDLYADNSGIDVSCKIQYTKVLCESIEKENLIIWGAGISGGQAFDVLMKNHANVKCFIDSDERLVGTIKCGIPVYAPKKLDDIVKDIVIIEAMEQWKDLDEFIKNNYEKRFHYQYAIKQSYDFAIKCDVDGRKETVFSLGADTFYYIGDKKIYIYGTRYIEQEAAKYLELLDIPFGGFLVDDVDREKGYGKYHVQYVEEILYETDFMVWVYDGEKVRKLDELGLKYFENYIYNIYATDITIKRKNVLDINLVHSYLSQNKYPGFMIYGSDKEESYRIVTLGGSTTDGMIYPFKSWSQILYEKIGQENITIYNGGVYSYNSGQEVVKLIRDVLTLRPNMVIVYDGFNDMYCKARYPYEFRHLGQVFEHAVEHVETNIYMEETKNEMSRGVESQQDVFNNWLSNIRTMYAIASERNIHFFSFCQPALCSKKGKTVQEKNMLLSTKSDQINFQINKSFRTCLERMAQIPSYMHDLSYIFDGKPDIYMDICHVWEEGNRIIA